MQPDIAYKFFSDQLRHHEALTVKTGNGGLSYYKSGVFVCHFNAKPRKDNDDLGFADFRYDTLRPYLDIEKPFQQFNRKLCQRCKSKTINFGALCIFRCR